jgi:hypothetical protein
MTERSRFSQTELSAGALVATTSAVLAWYESPLSGVQGATSATIAAVLCLGAFFLGLLVVKRRDPSWYSPQ